MSFALEPDDEAASLVGLLDSLLDQGVHVAGDLVIGLADVDLVRASLRLLVASEETARRTGRDAEAPPATSSRRTVSGRSDPPPAREGGLGPRPVTRSVASPSRLGDSRPIRNPERDVAPHDDDRALVDGVAKLVLTVVAVIHDLVERQAIRRVEAGTLDDDQVERLGVALAALEERMADVREVFGVTEDELNLDLGPLGHLR